MLYVVEIRRERDQLSDIMSVIREWLDGHRFEPDDVSMHHGRTKRDVSCGV